jgi:hypothetical protein
MLKQESARGFERRWLKPFGRSVVRISATLLILGGMVYATPIANLGTRDAGTAKVIRAANASLKTAEREFTSDSNTLNAADSSAISGDCTLSGNCQANPKIPEPQTLVLVGSGLLSIAGFLRRKLAR